MRNVINFKLIKVVFDVHYGRFILSLDLTADSLDGLVLIVRCAGNMCTMFCCCEVITRIRVFPGTVGIRIWYKLSSKQWSRMSLSDLSL